MWGYSTVNGEEPVNFINLRKKAVWLRDDLDEAQKIKHGRFLMVCLVNYLTKQWEGSPSVSRSKIGSLARDSYPYQPDKKVNCAWYPYLVMQKLFSGLVEKEALDGRGGSGVFYQLKGYQHLIPSKSVNPDSIEDLQIGRMYLAFF